VPTIVSIQPLLENRLCLAGPVPLPVLRLTEKLCSLLIAGLFGILKRVPSGLGAL